MIYIPTHISEPLHCTAPFHYLFSLLCRIPTILADRNNWNVLVIIFQSNDIALESLIGMHAHLE